MLGHRGVAPPNGALAHGPQPSCRRHLLAPQRPGHACHGVARTALERSQGQAMHELLRHVLPALASEHVGALQLQRQAVQASEVLGLQVAEARGHLQLCQQAVPSRTPAEGHVCARDVHHLLQVLRIAADVTKALPEVGCSLGNLSRGDARPATRPNNTRASAAAALGGVGRKLGELLFQRQSALFGCCAAGGAIHHLLDGTAEGSTCLATHAQNLFRAPLLLGIFGLLAVLVETALQALQVQQPTRQPLAADAREIHAVVLGCSGAGAFREAGLRQLPQKRLRLLQLLHGPQLLGQARQGRSKVSSSDCLDPRGRGRRRGGPHPRGGRLLR
mmetsp:Transcript_140709/g.437650  ORF Transcript_140709/g.437650 Transcript_140709/m.437650 type:complete len:332 (-) Transcript_140709:459-1454(-)